MIYHYQAYKADRKIAEGTIEAISEKNAEEALYRAGFKYVLDLKAKARMPKLHEMIPTLFGVRTGDIIDFSRQLAAFLESGSSLHAALSLLETQTNKPAMKDLLAQMLIRLEQGVSFSQIVREQSNVFPHSYHQIVQSCEKTGELEKGLRQIADYLESQAKTADRIKRALAYPVFVICLGIAVVVLMVTMVLPPILKLFDSFNADLPPATALAINMINFVTTYKMPLLGAAAAGVIALVLFIKVAALRKSLDRWMLRAPVCGDLIVQHNLGVFCRTAAMLMQAGLSLPSIMDVAIQSISGNSAVKKSFSGVKEKLLQGEGLAKPMAEDRFFPPMAVKMVKTGEQTGTLETALETLAAYYEEHSSKKIQSLIGMIEPALTICIGIGIAFVMYSMIIPIYRIMGSMG